MRMSRITGRTDDMLIIRGVNVFPSQIEEALLRVEGTTPHYLIEVSRPGTLDEVHVKVEIHPEIFSDRMDRMQALCERISREIQHRRRHPRPCRSGRAAQHRALRRQGQAGARQARPRRSSSLNGNSLDQPVTTEIDGFLHHHENQS